MIGDKALQVVIDRYMTSVRPKVQAELSKAIREAMDRGDLARGTVDAALQLNCEKLGLNVSIYGKVEL